MCFQESGFFFQNTNRSLWRRTTQVFWQLFSGFLQQHPRQFSPGHGSSGTYPPGDLHKWRWLGCFLMFCYPQKRVGAFGRKAMFCFNGCGFWLRTPFSLFLFLWFCRCFLFLCKSTFSNVIHDRFPVRRTGAMAPWWTDLGFLEAIKHPPNQGDHWF